MAKIRKIMAETQREDTAIKLFSEWYREDNGSVSDNEIRSTWDMWKNLKHDGDCIGEPQMCRRCFVEHFRQRANASCNSLKKAGG